MMANIIDEEAIDIILGEELTGERLKRAEDKIKSLGRRKSTADKRTSLFKVAYGKEGTGLPGSDGQSGGRKGPVKRGGGGVMETKQQEEQKHLRRKPLKHGLMKQ
jgi:hypothetical protein